MGSGCRAPAGNLRVFAFPEDAQRPMIQGALQFREAAHAAGNLRIFALLWLRSGWKPKVLCSFEGPRTCREPMVSMVAEIAQRPGT